MANCIAKIGQQISQLKEDLELAQEQWDSLVKKVYKATSSKNKLWAKIDRQVMKLNSIDQEKVVDSQEAIKLESQLLDMANVIKNSKYKGQM